MYLPEAEVIGEIDDCTDNCGGGGGGTWPPDYEDPEDPWEPPSGGGGGGTSDPCQNCEPGDDPNDPGEELCPLGEILDDNGNCVEEEPLDCMGVEGGWLMLMPVAFVSKERQLTKIAVQRCKKY